MWKEHCHTLNVCIPPKLYAEILNTNVMVLGGRALGDNSITRTTWIGLSFFKKKKKTENFLAVFLSFEGTERRSAGNQEEGSHQTTSKSVHALILYFLADKTMTSKFLVFKPPMVTCSVAELCLTLCNHMDCSLPGSFVHGVFRQEYWSGLPFPPPGIFQMQGLNLYLLRWQVDSLPLAPSGNPCLSHPVHSVIS